MIVKTIDYLHCKTINTGKRSSLSVSQNSKEAVLVVEPSTSVRDVTFQGLQLYPPLQT